MIIKTIQVGFIGTNCYLVWEKSSGEAFIIDPADYNAEIANTIKNEELRLKYIVLTHGHGDHIGGVPALMREYPDVKLAAGRNETALLADAKLNFSGEISGNPITLRPDICLSEGDELKVGDMTLTVIETPGHTEGGISILVGKTLFSGDTLFRSSIGRTDLPLGNYETLLESIREKLFTLPDDIAVYPGHMGETTIGFEKGHNPFV
jgi:glyoxylase-like metal-dependent hydrolase (beta-lactamase superfamily II)